MDQWTKDNGLARLSLLVRVPRLHTDITARFFLSANIFLYGTLQTINTSYTPRHAHCVSERYFDESQLGKGGRNPTRDKHVRHVPFYCRLGGREEPTVV